MLTIQTPSKDSLSQEAQTWAAKASALVIRDRETYIDATHFLRSVKSLENEIDAWFAPHVERAQDAKRQAEAARKGLCDERDRMKAPLMDAEQKTKCALLVWEQEQERLRREQEREAEERLRQEMERATLEAAAELEREGRATGNAEMVAEADAILAQPIDTPAVQVKSFMPKAEGITYRDNWQAHPEVDIKALCAAVAAGTVPTTYVVPNMTAINGVVRATKGAATIPGVRVVNNRIVAARA